jgi:hypothetical protein
MFKTLTLALAAAAVAAAAAGWVAADHRSCPPHGSRRNTQPPNTIRFRGGKS